MPADSSAFKRPESVLVVVYTRSGSVLLLKRVDHPDFWQSVTGAMEWDEHDPRETAVRELREETGIEVDSGALQDLDLVQRYPILPQWRYRYAPGITENAEHAFALAVPQEVKLQQHPEHNQYGWFEFARAARQVTSWTNRVAIERVARNVKTW